MSSAAKMVADSTQSDLPEKTRKRKKTVVKKKVKKKKDSEKRSRKKSEEDYDESDLDLENEIKPIGAYVKDREALLDQLFHCVKDASLDRNLPDVLKELPLEDLKRRCLEELEVMSKKRIRRILAGDDPGSISSSGTEEDTSEEEDDVPQEDDDLLEYDGFEAHLADSTSQYTQGLGDSDRELDDEVGSYVQDDASNEPLGSSHSYTPSDVEMVYTEDNEQSNDYNTNDDNYEEDIYQQDMEDDEMPQAVDVDQGNANTLSQPNASVPQPSFTNTIRVRRDSEETEEGEVFDDDDVGITENLDTNPDKTVGETTESVEGTSPSVETADTAADKTGDDNANEAKTEIVNDKENVQNTENTDKSVESDATFQAKAVQKPPEKTNQDDSSEEVNQITEDEKNGEVVSGNDNVENVVIVVQEGKMDDNEDTEGECVDTDNEETDGNNDGEKETDEGGREESKSANRIVLPPAEAIAPVLTKNQMELLELEMRARAIKAMLKMAK